MNETGRIALFVRASRNLLLMQVAAALLAVLLAVWALVAVWELAAERDRLRAQVQSLETKQPAPVVAAVPEASNEIGNGVRPPAILPIAIPVPQVAPNVNMIVPDADLVAPTPNQVTTPPAETAPPAEQDCSGAAAGQPRCRPGRWNRQIQQLPVPRNEPAPRPNPDSAAPPRQE
ncbi:MAG TPA: hypothetical protein VEZ41_01465 [Allosphingosinicella sp.]|nr:hypothetical protein [Allosphingosinicella sp.]